MVTTALLVLLVAAAVFGFAGVRLMVRHRDRVHSERTVAAGADRSRRAAATVRGSEGRYLGTPHPGGELTGES